MQKRMRVIAGPNGSGKTTILQKLRQLVSFGIYVNADDIELQLRTSKSLIFNQYQLLVTDNFLKDFFRESTFSPAKRNEIDLWTKVVVSNNILKVNTFVDSYLAADLAEFIRQQLLFNEISFTYETVMSHPNKLTFMQMARERGYRVYLYFIATKDPEINVNRVKIRVSQDGHPVDDQVIKNRYYKSLNLLSEAVKLSHRAYIFDNSKDTSELFAEITNGTEFESNKPEVKAPTWAINYLINKQN